MSKTLTEFLKITGNPVITAFVYEQELPADFLETFSLKELREISDLSPTLMPIALKYAKKLNFSFEQWLEEREKIIDELETDNNDVFIELISEQLILKAHTKEQIIKCFSEKLIIFGRAGFGYFELDIENHDKIPIASILFNKLIEISTTFKDCAAILPYALVVLPDSDKKKIVEKTLSLAEDIPSLNYILATLQETQTKKFQKSFKEKIITKMKSYDTKDAPFFLELYRLLNKKEQKKYAKKLEKTNASVKFWNNVYNLADDTTLKKIATKKIKENYNLEEYLDVFCDTTSIGDRCSLLIEEIKKLADTSSLKILTEKYQIQNHYLEKNKNFRAYAHYREKKEEILKWIQVITLIGSLKDVFDKENAHEILKKTIGPEVFFNKRNGAKYANFFNKYLPLLNEQKEVFMLYAEIILQAIENEKCPIKTRKILLFGFVSILLSLQDDRNRRDLLDKRYLKVIFNLSESNINIGETISRLRPYYIYLTENDRFRLNLLLKTERGDQMFMPKPHNHKDTVGFPKFEVAEIHSGAGTIAPNLGMRYSFSTESDAREYVAFAHSKGFQKSMQIVCWDSEGKGVVIEEKI